MSVVVIWVCSTDVVWALGSVCTCLRVSEEAVVGNRSLEAFCLVSKVGFWRNEAGYSLGLDHQVQLSMIMLSPCWGFRNGFLFLCDVWCGAAIFQLHQDHVLARVLWPLCISRGQRAGFEGQLVLQVGEMWRWEEGGKAFDVSGHTGVIAS